MLKRRLDWEEKAQDHAEEMGSDQEESDLSTSSEEESGSDEMDTGDEAAAEVVPVEESKLRKVKCMIIAGRGVNARLKIHVFVLVILTFAIDSDTLWTTSVPCCRI